MIATRARGLAWGTATLTMLWMVVAVVLAIRTSTFEWRVADLLVIAITAAFAIVGALIASRRPRNAIGWIFLAVSIATALAGVAEGYVHSALQSDAQPGALAGAAAVYADVSFVAFVMLPATFPVLLFPDGNLLSRAWRRVAWCAGAGLAGVFLVSSFTSDSTEFPTVANPFALEGAAVSVLEALSIVALYIGLFGGVASLVVRYRRAGRIQRQQIKWLATAGALLAVIMPLDVALSSTLGDAAYVMTTFAVLGLPAAFGIAILRHQLYDIDVVINRALVYGALTATLAGAYLGAVLLLQLALNPLTASSNLAIAVSTLAVAALFQPARRRIQAAVDRRFYRHKYDAARTLERFGSRLRDEVELDALSDDLRAIVAETMQPAHVSLWLRART